MHWYTSTRNPNRSKAQPITEVWVLRALRLHNYFASESFFMEMEGGGSTGSANFAFRLQSRLLVLCFFNAFSKTFPRTLNRQWHGTTRSAFESPSEEPSIKLKCGGGGEYLDGKRLFHPPKKIVGRRPKIFYSNSTFKPGEENKLVTWFKKFKAPFLFVFCR